MEIAFEQLLGQGVLGIFLIIVIVYFRSKEKKHEEIVKEKDAIILKALTDSISYTKDVNNTLEKLVKQN